MKERKINCDFCGEQIAVCDKESEEKAFLVKERESRAFPDLLTDGKFYDIHICQECRKETPLEIINKSHLMRDEMDDAIILFYKKYAKLDKEAAKWMLQGGDKAGKKEV